MLGTIKTLTEKGFGFIKQDEDAKDIFFHSSGLAGGITYNELQVGDRVEYEAVDSEKGPRAVEVTLVS